LGLDLRILIGIFPVEKIPTPTAIFPIGIPIGKIKFVYMSHFFTLLLTTKYMNTIQETHPNFINHTQELILSNIHFTIRV
jgi:hypothetical protein